MEEAVAVGVDFKDEGGVANVDFVASGEIAFVNSGTVPVCAVGGAEIFENEGAIGEADRGLDAGNEGVADLDFGFGQTTDDERFAAEADLLLGAVDLFMD